MVNCKAAGLVRSLVPSVGLVMRGPLEDAMGTKSSLWAFPGRREKVRSLRPFLLAMTQHTPFQDVSLCGPPARPLRSQLPQLQMGAAT